MHSSHYYHHYLVDAVVGADDVVVLVVVVVDRVALDGLRQQLVAETDNIVDVAARNEQSAAVDFDIVPMQLPAITNCSQRFGLATDLWAFAVAVVAAVDALNAAVVDAVAAVVTVACHSLASEDSCSVVVDLHLVCYLVVRILMYNSLSMLRNDPIIMLLIILFIAVYF